MSAVDTQDQAPQKTETTYVITVTKVIQNFPFRNRDYKEIGKDEEGEPEYGYVYFDDNKKVEQAIYEQTVENVDMPAIIKAVNGMEQ